MWAISETLTFRKKNPQSSRRTAGQRVSIGSDQAKVLKLNDILGIKIDEALQELVEKLAKNTFCVYLNWKGWM
jgi:hypothetical protein